MYMQRSGGGAGRAQRLLRHLAIVTKRDQRIHFSRDCRWLVVHGRSDCSRLSGVNGGATWLRAIMRSAPGGPIVAASTELGNVIGLVPGPEFG
jgi:hypothetical protein